MSLADDIDQMVAKHRRRGVLLDTNVLLLFIFSAFMPDKIAGSKRLAKYDNDASRLLQTFVQHFDKIITTKHVLAETSNLARQNISGKLWEKMATSIYPMFCLADRPEFEILDAATAKINHALFAKLGLTDAAIVANLNSMFLLTDDLDLYVAAASAGLDAINFTHMREAVGQL